MRPLHSRFSHSNNNVHIDLIFSIQHAVNFCWIWCVWKPTITTTTALCSILECKYYSRGFITLKLVFLLAKASVRAYTLSELRLIISMYSSDA